MRISCVSLNLRYITTRFPYLLQDDAVLCTTLSRLGWTVENRLKLVLWEYSVGDLISTRWCIKPSKKALESEQ